MRPDNQCLFDVGGLGRTGHKHAVAFAGHIKAVICCVHVRHDDAPVQHKHQMLRQKRGGPRPHPGFAQPYGPVLRHPEFAGTHQYIEPRQGVHGVGVGVARVSG